MLRVPFLLGFLLFQQASASGFLELSFKSDYNLKAVVNITASKPFSIIPFIVSAHQTVTLSKIPIDFNEEKYDLTLFVINEDKPGKPC